MSLGGDKLPSDLDDWPLEVRRALDAAENAPENPWVGSGRKKHRTRKALKILRQVLPEAMGKSAEFVAQEIQSLERLLALLCK